MESTEFFNNTKKIEKSHKLELEKAHNTNHANMVRNYNFSKRTMNAFPFEQKNKPNKLIISEPFNSNLILNNIEEITIILNKLNNFSSLKKNDIISTKNNLLEYLKQIRKELSKENISLIDAKKMINNKTQSFIELLFNDNFDPYIQLESLWIINNFIFLIAKYNTFIFFDIKNISNSLIKFLININKNKKNEGVKYTLEEKILRILGNLIYINNNILIELLINNNIFPFIINSLNSPIPSFRTTCLWLINKIILLLKRLDMTNYIKIFTEKNAISNFKFILTRLENQRSFEEIGELFWIFNELAKYDSSILVPIFFKDVTTINNNDLVIFNKDLPLKNFEFVLNNCLTFKMFQTCFRLISNLLIVCYKDFKDEDLLFKLIERLFLKQNILNFIYDILNSPKNKYDFLLVKDILLLIFNLICLSPIKSIALFRNGIVNLINDKDYQNDNEIMKLAFLIYYRILLSNSFIFEPNDEKVIRTCIFIMERFKDDNSILIIFIDILFLYLKASHAKIGDNVENEIKILCNCEGNIPIEKLQMLLFKLSNFVKMQFSFV